MTCPICKDEVPELKKPRAAHLVLHMDGENHVHVHGDLQKKPQMREMLDVAAQELGVSTPVGAAIQAMKPEIVFHNRQRIGDILMMTCAIRDFKAAFPNVRVNVITVAAHIWDHNPNIDRTLVATTENTVKIGPGELTNASNRLDWHFANAYRVSIEKALGVKFEQGESRPDIWLTQEEYDEPRKFDFPYWIICITGEKGWGCKMYPFSQWQEFVNQNPNIKFVQIGAREDDPPRLKGPNVIDYVGCTQDKQTGIRDLYKLFLNAEGSIGLVSFHMHLSGALHKPCVVVAGAREPVSFTRYAGHAYLSTDGMLPCAVKACWHCDIFKCTNPVIKNNERIPKCVDIISPSEITKALQGYYAGGRLSYDKPADKPKLKNIVKVVDKKTLIPTDIRKYDGRPIDISKYGPHFKFSGGAVSEADWWFMKQLIAEHKIKRVLEFGAGLSTLLFLDEGCEVITYETQERWGNRVKEANPKADIRMWDGQTDTLPRLVDGALDLVFVDGPSGGSTREMAVKIASESGAKFVIVHDGYHAWERKWQAKHMVGKYHGPVKHGGKCHFWSKDQKALLGMPSADLSTPEPDLLGKQAIVEAAVYADKLERTGSENTAYAAVAAVQSPGGVSVPRPQDCLNQRSKTIKIVSTARGWGGCARSVTTIMRLLLAMGHKVEFIPFRNKVSSGEFMLALTNELKEVKVTENYDSIREHCDVLFMYADDYVWEFKTPAMVEVFSDIGAEQKIMMVNYRRGDIGAINWTKGWDKYMFLNSIQEKDLLAHLPGVKTKVLPPCTNLDPFFAVKVDYENGLRIVRHNSQGDTKFDKSFDPMYVSGMLNMRQDLSFDMLPGPSWIVPSERFRKHGRTANPNVVANFLALGNLFWYSLPIGYADMGPRTILEAMAAGLPVIADNWGGAVDRVLPGVTGWLCDEKDEHVQIIKHVTNAELQKRGEAGREHARQEFVPERWVQEIINA